MYFRNVIIIYSQMVKFWNWYQTVSDIIQVELSKELNFLDNYRTYLLELETVRDEIQAY